MNMNKKDLMDMLKDLPDDQEIWFNVVMDSGRSVSGGTADTCVGTLHDKENPFQYILDDEQELERSDVFVIHVEVEWEWGE